VHRARPDGGDLRKLGGDGLQKAITLIGGERLRGLHHHGKLGVGERERRHGVAGGGSDGAGALRRALRLARSAASSWSRMASELR